MKSFPTRLAAMAACALGVLATATPASADTIDVHVTANVDEAYQEWLDLAGVSAEAGGTFDLSFTFSTCTNGSIGDWYMVVRDASGDVIDTIDLPGGAYAIANDDVYGNFSTPEPVHADYFGAGAHATRDGLPFFMGLYLASSQLDTFPGDPMDYLNDPLSLWNLEHDMAIGVAVDDPNTYYTTVLATVTSVSATSSAGPACEDPGPQDDDGDGIPDDADQCEDTASGQPVGADGCSVTDLVPCDGPLGGGSWKNHGEYMRSVAAAAKALLHAGAITKDQANAIVSAAASSGCGR